jgi:hypothetical protein
MSGEEKAEKRTTMRAVLTATPTDIAAVDGVREETAAQGKGRGESPARMLTRGCRSKNPGMATAIRRLDSMKVGLRAADRRAP